MTRRRTAHAEAALDIVLQAFRLANVLGQVGNRLAGTYGLTAQQWLALTSIGVAGDAGVTPTEIGRSALVSPQNVTGLLDRLERAGYVRRLPDGADRRSYRVRLSDKGAQVFHALNPLGMAWAQHAAAELPRERVMELRALLATYLAAATKAAFADGGARQPRLSTQRRTSGRREDARRSLSMVHLKRRPQRLAAK